MGSTLSLLHVFLVNHNDHTTAAWRVTAGSELGLRRGAEGASLAIGDSGLAIGKLQPGLGILKPAAARNPC